MPEIKIKGFVQLPVLLLAIIIIVSLAAISKNIPINEPQATPDKGFQGSSSAQLRPQPYNFNLGNFFNRPIPTPTPLPDSNNQKSENTSGGSKNENVSQNNQSANSTPTPTPTPTPPLKTYTWKGTNVDVTTSCNEKDPTFDITVSGSVPAQNDPNGIWTTLTDENGTIIIAYQDGDSTNLGFSFNDTVTSIRGEPSKQLITTTPSWTYGYELKIYSAPFTEGKPNLTNQLGNVMFATACN